MTTTLLIITIVLLVAILGLQVVALLRKSTVDLSPIQQAEEKAIERTERAVHEEVSKAAQAFRQEMSTVLKNAGDTLNRNFAALAEASSSDAAALRQEVAANLQHLNQSLVKSIEKIAKLHKGQLEMLAERLGMLTKTNEQTLDQIRETIEKRLSIIQAEIRKMLAHLRPTVRDDSEPTLRKRIVRSHEKGDGETAKREYNPQAENRIKKTIEQRGGKVTVDVRHPEKRVVGVDLSGTQVTDVEIEQLTWLTNLTTLDLGNTQVADAGLKQLKGLIKLRWLSLWNTQVTANGLKHLGGLTQLQWLDLASTKVTDAGLEHLRDLTNLETLDLGRTQVTDAGLQHLRELTQLQTLDLTCTLVTDVGLEHLKVLTNLHTLDLGSTQVTDAGLEYLKESANLQRLDLRETKVTDECVMDFRQALPNCTVWYANGSSRRQVPLQPASCPRHESFLDTSTKAEEKQCLVDENIVTEHHNDESNHKAQQGQRAVVLDQERREQLTEELEKQSRGRVENATTMGPDASEEANDDLRHATSRLSNRINEQTPLEREQQRAHDLVLRVLHNLENGKGPVLVQDLERAVLGNHRKVNVRELGYANFLTMLEKMQLEKTVLLRRRHGERHWRVNSSSEQKAWVQEYLAVKSSMAHDSDDEFGDEFVASSIHQAFHKANCKLVFQIGTRNRLMYESREEAINAGKTPCDECKP